MFFLAETFPIISGLDNGSVCGQFTCIYDLGQASSGGVRRNEKNAYSREIEDTLWEEMMMLLICCMIDDVSVAVLMYSFD